MASSPARWKWAYSSNAFTRMYLVEAIGRVHDLGFDGIEILADTPHAWPPALDDDAIERISGALERTGLRISNVNANTCRGGIFANEGLAGPGLVPGLDEAGRKGRPYEGPTDPGPTILDPDPAIREIRLRHLEQSLALTSRIGGSVMSLTSGPSPSGEPAKVLDERVDAALRRLLPLAEKLGVRLAIEYEPGFHLGTAESTAAVLARFPTMSLGVNLDLGHAYCVGENPAAVIRRFDQRILNCHVEDIKDRVHFHLVPGDGEMPWGDIRAALLQIDYRRFLTLELYTMLDDPLGAGKRGLAYLRTVFSGA